MHDPSKGPNGVWHDEPDEGNVAGHGHRSTAEDRGPYDAPSTRRRDIDAQGRSFVVAAQEDVEGGSPQHRRCESRAEGGGHDSDVPGPAP